MLVEVSKVSHWFTGAGSSIRALTGIDLSVMEGEFLSVIGPSGCGKTTLLNMIAGLGRPEQGSLKVFGVEPRAGDARTGYVLARDSLLPWRSAQENAELALEMYGVPRKERMARAGAALAAMGLAGFEYHFPAQLSQGMRQRVALARSFGARPRLILMDEPFSALDAQTRLAVHDQFLRAWENHKMTVVLITHDLTEAVGLSDRVAIMTKRPGRIKAIHEVDLPRPRSMAALQGNTRFHAIYGRIWRDLQDEFLEADASADGAASPPAPERVAQ
ncbi:ABC transporter ATP-binding protein [Chelativorans sp. AA-79]|uniref:ABC transporter ATP-binding protein n=1 Tax=Chelativorans sp. AA-79 TaxID=3028735 RepID=UPI0023F831BF|nr:ABC transporter ATP-binding protein [Chelativorans sp. AA-79]WEX12058.1 ABC transporter ATP-binding protein [Chelativorans sp. AA-79]